MRNIFTVRVEVAGSVRVEVPALDALVAYLTAGQQAAINTAAEEIAAATDRLKKSRARLGATQNNNQ